MKYVTFDKNLKGEILAVPIYSASGLVLVNKGTEITDKIIDIVSNLGITSTYIEDKNSNIIVKDIVDMNIRFEIIKNLENEFKNFKNRKKIDDSLIFNMVEEIIDNMDLSENAFLYNHTGHTDNSKELYFHSFDVCILSMLIGIKRKFDRKKLTYLGMGALLHDIGKLYTDSRSHTIEGYNAIKNTGLFPTTSYLCIYQHHEMEDGSGYPQSLTGDKIYENSKIVSICNEYLNLLSSERKLQPDEALDILTVEASTRFSYDIYKDFMETIYCYPNGMPVKLSNGLEGIVLKQNKGFPSRPVIGVTENSKPLLIDLTTNNSMFIKKIII